MFAPRAAREEQGWDSLGNMTENFAGSVRYGNDPGGYSYSRYSGQPRTASGRFRRMRFSHEMEREKEELAPMLAHSFGYDELKDKAIKEASEIIKAATECDEYAMLKEFAELCIVMKAFAEILPEGMEEAAVEEAIEYYSHKVGKEVHPFAEYMRRSRSRRSYR